MVESPLGQGTLVDTMGAGKDGRDRRASPGQPSSPHLEGRPRMAQQSVLLSHYMALLLANA